MIDELVKYPTAKLAKLKGFDEQTKNAFDENGEQVFCDPYTVNVRLVGLGNPQGHKWWNSKEIGKYARPSQSLLQRWLREVHKIHIIITSISQESWQYHITKVGDSLGKLYNEDYDDYEKALEDSLVDALNLIK